MKVSFTMKSPADMCLKKKKKKTLVQLRLKNVNSGNFKLFNNTLILNCPPTAGEGKREAE